MSLISNFSFVNLTEMEYFDHDTGSRLDVTHIVINSLILFSGLCANLWMIWSLCKTWKSNSRLHFFPLPLSVADILTLCARCGVAIGVSVTLSWRGGYYTCIFAMMFMTFSSCLAHLILTFLNVDNVITIACDKTSRLLRIVFILVAVLVSIAASIPEGLIFTVLSLRDDICTHREDWGNVPYIYDTVFDVVHTLLPLVIMMPFGVIGLVLWCAKKDKRPRAKLEGPEHEHLKMFGRAAALTLVFDVFFLLCWGPETIIRRGHEHMHIFLDYWIVQLAQCLATANGLINPVIYASFYCITKERQTVSQDL